MFWTVLSVAHTSCCLRRLPIYSAMEHMSLADVLPNQHVVTHPSANYYSARSQIANFFNSTITLYLFRLLILFIHIYLKDTGGRAFADTSSFT